MNAYLLTDSLTMLRRSLRRMRRYPSLTFFIAVIPVVVLLLFVYVLGGTLGAGLGGAGSPAAGRWLRPVTREAYLAYIVPGHPADHRRRQRRRARRSRWRWT